MEHRVRDRGTDPPTDATDDKAAAATPAATEHHQAHGVAGGLALFRPACSIALARVGDASSARTAPSLSLRSISMIIVTVFYLHDSCDMPPSLI